ncbi:MAG: CHAT domain-containing protein [Cyanobacteriota bacterium]
MPPPPALEPALPPPSVLRGVALENPPPPALLRPQARPAGRDVGASPLATAQMPDEDLLSPAFVRVDRAFDLTASAREATAIVSPLTDLPDEQVVVLELVEDGGTAITTAGDLRRRQEHWLSTAAATSQSQRGVVPTGLFSRLYTLTFGDDGLQRVVEQRLKALAREQLGEAVGEAIQINASWLATKLLLKLTEDRLPCPPGLYRWRGGASGGGPPLAADDPTLRADAACGLLVFVHGTGSNSQAGFGELATAGAGIWPLLESAYGERIYGFEQQTFSASPIDNALALAQSLPCGARLNLVSHGSGGLVADLLCAEGIEDALIEAYRYPSAEKTKQTSQRDAAAAEQRERLRQLRGVLAEKALRIERYVRVASPARGSRLLGDNLDLFLSVLLSLISGLPALAGQPAVAVLKRLVLDVVRRRLDPCLIPGLAALAPDAPLAALLDRLPPRSGLAMATLSGQRSGGHPLQRLALLFSDTLFFQRCPNDLIVDTDAMQAGLARRAGAHGWLEKGPSVNHFHYFARPSCARALARWLTERQPLELGEFLPLASNPGERERLRTRESDAREEASAARGRGASVEASQPVVVVVPGFMGSHLWRQTRQERIWFDPRHGIGERLRQLSDLQDAALEPEKLLDLIYGDLCRTLLESHRVVRFPYDWRQPLELLAERLGAVLRPLVAEAEERRPVRLLAHGMGGLVVRACMARDPDLWQRLIQLKGARFLMLGTPNHGSHALVETLLGQSPMIRNLARVSRDLELRELVALVAGFPGALQLLPRPGAESLDGAAEDDLLSAHGPFNGLSWYAEELWTQLKSHNRDRWFGDQLGATPDAATLTRGRWLWEQPASLAELSGDPDRVIYVHGQARRTPCGVTLRQGQLRMLSTTAGDGVVTWNAGRWEGIGHYYRMEADHGSLPCRRDHFPALVELLREGGTNALAPMPRTRGSGDAPPPVLPWQPGPTPFPSEEELFRSLVGGQPLPPEESAATAALQVSCHAMDVRYVNQPVMVGHYEADAIAAAEALIDRDLVAGELSSRNRLGLYAGPRGTATVVLMTTSARELREGGCRGAVVIGLGTMGELSTVALTEAVRVGTLRYLLQLLDRATGATKPALVVGLASLLIGQNSGNDIHIDDSVTALVEGVLAANEQFATTFPAMALRVGQLQLVELYLDTAITATRALAGLESRLNRDGVRVLNVERELQFGKGWRHRLAAAWESGYWPRMLISNGEPAKGDGPTADSEGQRPGVQLANTLSFSFLGQRARAETLQQKRQSGLVEALVAACIQTPTTHPDLSRTLFQLLVPSSFKQLARQLEQLVLVLDDTTANVPWELLMADDKPLALQLAVVRQLQASRFRERLHKTTSRNAYVIGNPSSEGFFKVFVGEGSMGSTGLASLEGARQEAESVLSLLRERAYDCEESIQEENAVDVINKLYRRPYRLLHIAGHGVYDHPSRSGERRSGVVLAGGLLITVSEIEAREVVPDLVFLNCCHLGTVKREPVAFNRLAASVAAQLIEMGVRAVVACGWAVDDTAALAFAQTFYTAMLQGVPFGNAVFLARKEAHAVNPNSTTWGAYQAYGDPDYQLEESRGGSSPGLEPATAEAAEPRPWSWVTPMELIDQLQQLVVRLRQGDSQAPVRQSLPAELESLLKTAPPAWLSQAEVAVAVADVYAACGGEHQEEACRHYLAAIRAHQGTDRLPIRAIEQLANLEARLGERSDDAPRVMAAIERLRALLRIASAGATPATGSAAAGPPEWQALLGSAWKRLAALRARALVASGRAGKEALQTVMEPLEAAIAAYGLAGGDLCNQLNLLALQAVRDLHRAADAQAIRHAQALAEEHQGLARSQAIPTFWSAVAGADALLVGRLVDHQLAAEGAPGEATARQVLESYQEVFLNVRATLLERESVLEQLSLLADVARARGRSRTDLCPAAALLAQRLETIERALRESALGRASPLAAGGDREEEDAMETLS